MTRTGKNCRMRTAKFLVSLLIVYCVDTVCGDYNCLCNYDVERQVYPQPDVQTSPVGYLYEFDCKEIVNYEETPPGWDVIAFEHQRGYVQEGSQQHVARQVCSGLPPASDLLTTQIPTTMAITTTTARPITTTTTVSTTTKSTITTTTKATTVRTTPTSTTSPVPTTARILTEATTNTLFPYFTPLRLVTTTQKPIIGNINLCPAILHQYTREDGGALTQYGDYCYELVPIRAIWSKAEQDCMAKGGDLFHINNQELQNYIYRWIKSYSFDHAVWTGLHDVRTEEHFEWISGDHVIYTNWYSDRKGNLASHYNEDCVLFVPYAPYYGKWDDVICGSTTMFGDIGQQNPFICEYFPDDFHDVLKSYTQHGFRVLALAWKQLSAKYNYVKVQRVQREKVETDLTFIGLLIMENKLKPETTPVIEQLNEANVRTIMVTGDNMLTALSVAHDCKMVGLSDKIVLVEAQISTKDSIVPQMWFVYEENTSFLAKEKTLQSEGDITGIEIDEDNTSVKFAMSGKSWEVVRAHFPEQLQKILVRGVVFARMSPEQKAQLVEALQGLGYYVAMCGDGANDCGALKMAHTGISLSEAEASVASPFTSKNPNVECVPTVIREGRAALVTSFGIFKYMACYSLTQFVSVLILYKVESNFTDFEFLYIDLILLTTLSVTYGRTEAFPRLVKEPPQLRLTSPAPIMSLVLQMAIQIAAQVFCFYNVQQQPWFSPHVHEEEYDYACYENAAVFSVSVFQYISLAIAFSKGSPYRKNMFTNYLFLLNIVLCFAFSIWLTVYPPERMAEFFELQSPPSVVYRLVFFGVAAVNCLLSIILETFLLDHAIIREKFRRYKERCFPSLKFEYSAVEEEIVSTPGWPPVGGDPISAIYRDDASLAEMYSMETDKMLPGSADSNSSAYCSTQSFGYTPRTSTTENPYTSASSVVSMPTHSESDPSEGVRDVCEPLQETAELEESPCTIEKAQDKIDWCGSREKTHLVEQEADHLTR